MSVHVDETARPSASKSVNTIDRSWRGILGLPPMKEIRSLSLFAPTINPLKPASAAALARCDAWNKATAAAAMKKVPRCYIPPKAAVRDAPGIVGESDPDTEADYDSTTSPVSFTWPCSDVAEDGSDRDYSAGADSVPSPGSDTPKTGCDSDYSTRDEPMIKRARYTDTVTGCYASEFPQLAPRVVDMYGGCVTVTLANTNSESDHDSDSTIICGGKVQRDRVFVLRRAKRSHAIAMEASEPSQDSQTEAVAAARILIAMRRRSPKVDDAIFVGGEGNKENRIAIKLATRSPVTAFGDPDLVYDDISVSATSNDEDHVVTKAATRYPVTIITRADRARDSMSATDPAIASDTQTLGRSDYDSETVGRDSSGYDATSEVGHKKRSFLATTLDEYTAPSAIKRRRVEILDHNSESSTAEPDHDTTTCSERENVSVTSKRSKKRRVVTKAARQSMIVGHSKYRRFGKTDFICVKGQFIRFRAAVRTSTAEDHWMSDADKDDSDYPVFTAAKVDFDSYLTDGSSISPPDDSD
ncbi:hypothetical protein OQA88_1404 [Cercophora sp. LCS_1]